MAWCTEEEALTYTTITVDAATIAAAQGIIEILAGRAEEDSDDGRINTYNLRLLKRAVAYQAAFMTAHPDLFTSMSIATMSEGSGSGMRLDFNTDDAVYLAPMAKTCLSRLSWKATRAIRVQPANRGARRRIALRSADFDGIEVAEPGDWQAL